MAERKRNIFEEVGTPPGAAQEAPKAVGAIDRGARSGARGAARLWLVTLFALVCIMIAVGGLTRLTDSGLSITEWAPLAGALPPLSDADWAREFDAYRAIPEYRLQNRGMSLAEFKVIYWWEWGHRQLGRVIGVVWAAGFLALLATRTIPRGWSGRFLFVGGLGGLQGAIGWWMVASGLEGTMLDVASYRLAVHLGLAFVILGLLAWYVMQLSRPQRDLLQARRDREARLWTHATGLALLCFLQIVLGALVAGIDAGRNYTDWPLMAGGVLPPGVLELDPLWRNLLENDGTVQFLHRSVGYCLAIYAFFVWRTGRASVHVATRRASGDLLALLAAQMLLGIVTVMHSAPWQLAILHQATAVALWIAILRLRHLAGYPLVGSLRGRPA